MYIILLLFKLYIILYRACFMMFWGSRDLDKTAARDSQVAHSALRGSMRAGAALSAKACGMAPLAGKPFGKA